MSWSLVASGSLEEVRREILGATCSPPESCFTGCKALVLAAIAVAEGMHPPLARLDVTAHGRGANVSLLITAG